jgi:hypothetical protein
MQLPLSLAIALLLLAPALAVAQEAPALADIARGSCPEIHLPEHAESAAGAPFQRHWSGSPQCASHAR